MKQGRLSIFICVLLTPVMVSAWEVRGCSEDSLYQNVYQCQRGANLSWEVVAKDHCLLGLTEDEERPLEILCMPLNEEPGRSEPEKYRCVYTWDFKANNKGGYAVCGKRRQL